LIDLDRRIFQRNQELQKANEQLQREAAERAQAEQALADEKQLLDVTLRSISDGVLTTDREGHILFMNRAVGVMTGKDPLEAEGTLLAEVLPVSYAEHGDGPKNLTEAVLQAGEQIEFSRPIMVSQPDGSQKRLTVNGAPLSDAEGNTIGVVFTFRDTTMWHLLETERFKANKLESVGVLAGGIAHDFNNILTAILGNISSIKASGEISRKQLYRLTAAENATRRAELLTKQLLTFAKGGAPVLKPSSIRELIQETADFALRGSNVRCLYDFPEELWTVHIDEGQISQVINNLTINAYQAMPEGGTIIIRGENIPQDQNDRPLQLDPGAYVKISIIDAGVGIASEHLPNIFDPYYTTKQKGSGLGLTSSYSIIRNHNGYISVESEPGLGSTFFFFLPALPHRKIEVEEDAPLPESGQGRILVMDDEEEIRHLCYDLLSDFGYEVVCVSEGSEAIEEYRKAQKAGRPFDLVILDLTIPGGMGGKETIERLLAVDPGVKAVVSSGYSANPVMSEYKSFGFTGVLQKPFDFPSLGALVDRIIRS
jgi:PAS domain S-box-containing protein